MAETQGSSFIPKQPAQGKVKHRSVRKIYVFAYISFVLFCGTLIATGLTFFFNVNVNAELKAAQQTLIEQRQAYSQSDIERIKQFDKQLRAASQLLNNHVSAVTIFDALEQTTVETLWYDEFEMVRVPEGVEVFLTAQADSLNTVLFQQNVLDDNSLLAGATIEELSAGQIGEGGGTAVQNFLTTDQDLNATFLVTKTFSPQTISYIPRDLEVLTAPAATQSPEALPSAADDTAEDTTNVSAVQ